MLLHNGKILMQTNRSMVRLYNQSTKEWIEFKVPMKLLPKLADVIFNRD